MVVEKEIIPMKKELYQEEMCKFCRFRNCCKEDIVIGIDYIKCNNFKKRYTHKKKYIDFVKYMYYDENGLIKVIIKDGTPTGIIHELQSVYDKVMYR